MYHFREDDLVPLRKFVARDRSWMTIGDSGMPRFAGFGGMYSAVALQIFGEYLEAGKVMGLAPYGHVTHPASSFFTIEGNEPRFVSLVPDRYTHDRRWPELEDDYRDLAASVQNAVEEGISWAAEEIRAITSSRHLAYAGGVALNCPANESILRDSGFDQVFVMPAAEDSGTSIGAAVAAMIEAGRSLPKESLQRDSAGRSYLASSVASAVREFPHRGPVTRTNAKTIAKELADGGFVGWFSAGSELGPRALGHRSILADPRNAATWSELNRRKGREGFRPLAPVVLFEHAADWFEMGPLAESPFMLRVCRVLDHQAEQIPAVTHVDGTARVQTLRRDQNPGLYDVIAAFREITGIPVLVNTSFNSAGEPIVETPEDALWAAASLELSMVVFNDV
ncbi:MAG: carbamoyltransferase C-terminal domain-containing protein, partial [bacterium]